MNNFHIGKIYKDKNMVNLICLRSPSRAQALADLKKIIQKDYVGCSCIILTSHNSEKDCVSVIEQLFQANEVLTNGTHN